MINGWRGDSWLKIRCTSQLLMMVQLEAYGYSLKFSFILVILLNKIWAWESNLMSLNYWV